MSDRATDVGVGVGENNKMQAPGLADLLGQLDFPGRKQDLPGTAQVPKDLPDLLKHKPDLKPTDWLPPAPISEEQLRQAALREVTPDAQPAKPAQVVDAVAREYIITQLKPADRQELDSLRLELAVSTGDKEKQAKQGAIKALLVGKLGDKLPEAGINALLSPPPLADLLAEIKSARPAEIAQLQKHARNMLTSNAEHVITDGAKLKDFNDKLTAFDTRAANRGMSEAELVGTYLQVGRVLDPGLKLEHGDKSLLARSMMANSADPTTIDQGGHNTCNVTALECRMFTQEPGTASKVIADLACAGKFVAADGTVVRPLNLDPDDEAKQDPTSDGSRNYASQLFQLTAINSYWNRRDTLPGGKTVGKGNIQYAQNDGECLLDMTTNPPSKTHFDTIDAGQPWLDIFGISEINQQLTSRPSKDLGIRRWVYSDEEDGVHRVGTFAGFKDLLVQLEKENGFPILIEVDAAKKPFGDGTGYGPHVVTITDYDAASGLVSVDNQWGKGADMTDLPGQGHRPKAEVLWRSMSPVPGIDFFKSKIKDGLKDIKLHDALYPATSALSTKGLFWGLGASAPLAVRGGLGYLSEWGVPGAESVLSASQTRLGAAALRAGTSLAALGAYAYINDLPHAFAQGNSYGSGKLLRVAGDWATYKVGEMVTSKALSVVPLWAPARIGLSLAAGIATSTVFDHLLGEGSEVGGSWLYDRAREYLHPNPPLAQPDKALQSPPPPDNHCAKLSDLGDKQSMTSRFVDRYRSYDYLFKGRR